MDIVFTKWSWGWEWAYCQKVYLTPLKVVAFTNHVTYVSTEISLFCSFDLERPISAPQPNDPDHPIGLLFSNHRRVGACTNLCWWPADACGLHRAAGIQFPADSTGVVLDERSLETVPLRLEHDQFGGKVHQPSKWNVGNKNIHVFCSRAIEGLRQKFEKCIEDDSDHDSLSGSEWRKKIQRTEDRSLILNSRFVLLKK